jgi:hypothetical protein
MDSRGLRKEVRVKSIAHEKVGDGEYRFLFPCDYPGCDNEEWITGVSYPGYETVKEIEDLAIHHELKHGEWTGRSSFGDYCPLHIQYMYKIIGLLHDIEEIKSLQNKIADTIEMLEEKYGVTPETIEKIKEREMI